MRTAIWSETGANVNHCDILIPGQYNCDLIFTGIPGFPALGTEIYTEGMMLVPGGGSLNTVTALGRLGIDAAWLGVLGSDPFSRIIDEWATQERLDRRWLTHVDAPLQRVTVAMSYPQDRAFLTHADPSPDLMERTMRAVDAHECEHLHFSGLRVHPRTPDLLRLCHQRGVMVTMDCQHRDETLDDPLVCEIVSLLDMFMPNASEAMRLTETSSIEAAAEVLRALVPLLVIKDGERGAQAWQGDLHVSAPALRVEVVDTTGAGDVFNAGFFAAHRAGFDLLTCLRWGNICGGLSTAGYGGCTAAPTRAVVERYLAETT